MTGQKLLLTLMLTLLATGCTPTQPDYGPIGSGLTAIAICIVVYGVVGVLGELVRHNPPDSKPPRPKRRKPRDGK